METEYFHIQRWIKDEQNRDDRRDMDFSDDDRFTVRDDVPIVEEDNSPYNGE